MGVDDTTIEETVSYVAVQRLLGAYADVVNRRAWEELEELFLDDAKIDITPSSRAPLELTGPAALGRFIGDAIERFEFFQFVFLNSRLEFRLDEDRASGRNFMCELRQERESGRWSRVFGVYHDRFRRVEGRWWFEHRTFNALAATGRDNLVFDFPSGFEALFSGGG
ncbi:MAG: nuclear transport factor 2 family protein [Deltaproteobacteria bacterium]|nr:nuclear transport factor 2 family protein [Deltaproteobacteria bacterium]